MGSTPDYDSDAAISSARGASKVFADLAFALRPHGLIVRGGFNALPGEVACEDARSVILIGNAGGAMWEAFAAHIDGDSNPLDRWTRGVVDPIAREFRARAVYPFGPEVWPFQRWALRAEPVHASPLGILIHPDYGLWHAYRAALLFAEELSLPQRDKHPSPCDSCEAKPCLSACPVGAFSGTAYDVPACAGYLATDDAGCRNAGCQARNACPVGPEWRYPDAEIRFHMAAFSRSVLRKDA
jgi:ferredoxin